MTDNVPRWIGFVGLVLQLIFCIAYLAGQLWYAVALLIPLFVLVYFESRYVNGGEKPDPMHFE